MLFAELDATGWSLLITAACLGIGGIVTSALTLILTYRSEQAKIERDRIAEEKAEQREQAKLERDRIAAEKIVKLTDNVNGLQEKFVAKTEAEGLARGALEERDRADAVAAKTESVPRAVTGLPASDVKHAAINAIQAIEGVAQAVEEVPEKTSDMVVEKIKPGEAKP